MRGCLAALGFLLLFPGACFLAFGDLTRDATTGPVLLGVAVFLIALAIVLPLFWKGDR